MPVFRQRWDAFTWCLEKANDDCEVLVSDWFDPDEEYWGKTARLKWESDSKCFFFRGLHEVPGDLRSNG